MLFSTTQAILSLSVSRLNFTEYNELCISYGTIGIQCMSDKPDRSPPLALFVKSPHGMIEVLHHWDRSKKTGSKTDTWDHSWCNFPGDFWTSYSWHSPRNKRASRTPICRWANWLSFHCSWKIEGICTESPQLRQKKLTWMRLKLSKKIIDNRDPPVRGYPESYVQRMGLAEHRVLVGARQFICLSSLETTGQGRTTFNFQQGITMHGWLHLRWL